jgi:hypothetical protein
MKMEPMDKCETVNRNDDPRHGEGCPAANRVGHVGVIRDDVVAYVGNQLSAGMCGSDTSVESYDESNCT